MDIKTQVLPQEIGNCPDRKGTVAQSTPMVLVLEDDRYYGSAVRRTLERAGMRVMVARDASEAAKIFEEEERVDLLLSDIVLPSGDGRLAARAFADSNPHLKVLFMSAYEEEDLQSYGATIEGEYISKERGEHALAAAVSNTLAL